MTQASSSPGASPPVSVSPEQQALNDALGRYGEAQLQLEFWTEAKANAKLSVEKALEKRNASLAPKSERVSGAGEPGEPK